MQAIILAGGLGTRLRSIVSNTPKALSPVAGNPFLYYIIQYLNKHGITDYIFSLGYLSNQIIDFLNEQYPSLSYRHFIEEIPLGTGGGIKKAIELATEENVLIVNADTYFDISLQKMFDYHKVTNAICTISLKTMEDFDRYGSVVLDNDCNITSFKEKTFTKQGLINGGYLIINKFFYLLATQQFPEAFSFEKEFLEKNLQKIIVKGFVSNGYFIDIGIPEDFIRAQKVFSDSSLIN